jgi:putative tricarboxylic transport membrane protein
MRVLRAENILGTVVIVGALVYLWADIHLPATNMADPLGPKAFPALIGGGLVLSGLLLYLEGWKKQRSAERQPAEPVARVPIDKGQIATLCAMIAWTVLYYATFETVGYLIGTPIFIFGLLSYFHRRRYFVNLAVAIGFTVIAYALFSLLLHVPLPTGPLTFLEE